MGLMPMPTTAMVATAHTATARGLLMLSPLPLLRPSLRLMPITATVDTALAMAHTAMARGPLMPMPTTAMAVMAHTAMARGPLMLTTDLATAMEDTATARGLLMPTTVAAMAAMAHTTDKLQTVSKREDTSEIKPKFVCCFQKCQELI